MLSISACFFLAKKDIRMLNALPKTSGSTKSPNRK
jgi:hypothetical protein